MNVNTTPRQLSLFAWYGVKYRSREQIDYLRPFITVAREFYCLRRHQCVISRDRWISRPQSLSFPNVLTDSLRAHIAINSAQTEYCNIQTGTQNRFAVKYKFFVILHDLSRLFSFFYVSVRITLYGVHIVSRHYENNLSNKIIYIRIQKYRTDTHNLI